MPRTTATSRPDRAVGIGAFVVQQLVQPLASNTGGCAERTGADTRSSEQPTNKNETDASRRKVSDRATGRLRLERRCAEGRKIRAVRGAPFLHAFRRRPLTSLHSTNATET